MERTRSVGCVPRTRTNQKPRDLSSFVFRLSSFVFRLSSFVFSLSS
ncbi:MAG: hypothetical protein HFP77_01595 [Methylococcales symbiont of Iophon sp. n. MRB-2018]|nr:MAG: hypothetical protein HFP77_01595 [Methylococcales symbiont of Iophon sp. n. MRB-2018]